MLIRLSRFEFQNVMYKQLKLALIPPELYFGDAVTVFNKKIKRS